MNLTIVAKNDVLDLKGGSSSQGFDVVDENGRAGWLVQSILNRLDNGPLDLKPGDPVLADDFVAGSRWPLLIVANFIAKIPVGAPAAEAAL